MLTRCAARFRLRTARRWGPAADNEASLLSEQLPTLLGQGDADR
jgi:hypothetical protein